jgi:hypothetical protein
MQPSAKLVWDCREARTQIALEVGGDLEDSAATERLQSHLHECPDCRRYLSDMQSVLGVFAACARPENVEAASPRLWSRIAAELPDRSRRSAYSQFNVWVPAAAMSIACAAMLLVTILQLEQVSPFEPILTPRIHSALNLDSPRMPLEGDRLPRRRGERSNSGSLPVGFSNAAPLPLESPFDPRRAGRHWSEW